MTDGGQSGERFAAVLAHQAVQSSAKNLREAGREPTLADMLSLGCALAQAAGDGAQAKRLRAELEGYESVGLEVPSERRVTGFASPFPVRAIGFLDPEEIFLANREKFSQVTLTIGQAIEELEASLAQIEQGGVLALKIPASEVSGDAILDGEASEVYIYILPREIERVVTTARRAALNALVWRIVDGALGGTTTLRPEPSADATPTEDLAAVEVDSG
jgi:hypothetical protein